MMKIRSYRLKDVDVISKWLLARDLAPIDPEDLPPRGWILMDENKPVGAVFLRLCEGNYAIMDSLINDPEQTSEKRHAINDRLFVHLMKKVRQNKLRGIFGTTLDKGTLERAMRHDFVPSTQTLLVWRNEKVN